MFFKKIKTDDNKKIDMELISKIQPAGNLLLSDDYFIQTGNGFTACVQVYSYPSDVYDFWLSNLTGLNDVIAVVDIATEDRAEAQKALSKTMTELDVRFAHSGNESDSMESEHDYRLAEKLLRDMKTAGEVLKLLVCRLYISAGTREELETKINKLIKDLDGKDYQACCFLKETQFQFKAILAPYSEQLLMPNKRVGVPLSSLSLAGGYSFNYEHLDDKFGQYLGYTDTGGNVIFDLYHKDKKRLSYDALVVGKKGSGKSTTLKKLLKDNAIIGNYVRVIDVEGEFTALAEELGGKVITLDGQHSRLNYLEVFKTAESEEVSFQKHLSKLNTFYEFYSPTSSDTERNEFEEYARKLYVKMGLWNERIPRENKITGLPSERYPIFSDLLRFVREDLYTDFETKQVNPNFSESRLQRLERIESVLSNVVESFGGIFNGYTTVPDLMSEKIIVYNTQNISSMKSSVFNAQLYNILSLMVNDIITIGVPSKKMFERGVPRQDIPKLLLIVDEAAKIISTSNQYALDDVIELVREGRKFFTGLILATQSIRDFAPENSSSEAVEKLKTLFELIQYKFIMLQDTNSLNLMRDIFEGELTESQLTQIPRFEQGQCVLSLGSGVTVNLTVEVTNEELDLFKGGA